MTLLLKLRVAVAVAMVALAVACSGSEPPSAAGSPKKRKLSGARC